MSLHSAEPSAACFSADLRVRPRDKRWRSGALRPLAVGIMAGVAACARPALVPFDVDTPPLVLVPASYAGIDDGRGRFREIFCAVLQERRTQLVDYRPCDEALTRVGNEPEGSGRAVDLGPSRRALVAAVVPGVGWGCVEDWLAPTGSVVEHLRRHGYDLAMVDVDALSSSARNARRIRDAVVAMPVDRARSRLVLVGYSKGASDVLEAVVSYPEIHDRIAAIVSVAGAVGGSPLADDATQNELELLRHFPNARCDPGDRGALESLRPATRRTWLADNTLPPDLRYYSVVTYPQPERISWLLRSSYKKLGTVDRRNDSQLIFYDQMIPGSTIVGFLNADHWAIAVPIARKYRTMGTWLVDQNDYPREALVEALLRYIEEDLDSQHPQ